MEPKLTIGYITGREEPRFEWFYESLRRQSGNELIPIIKVDRFCGEMFTVSEITNTPPKPNVWCGEFRLTNQDWFACAAFRNTVLCLCKTEWIAFVDDLSVLLPGWLDAVKEAMNGGYIVAGAYRKVRNLEVENGEVKHFDPHSDDCRLALAAETVGPCSPEWLYGCSCAMPVDALLSINGWPESLCDGMGFEDCLTGIVLGNAGFHLKYDKRMMTLESEEDHHREPSLRREDYGVSPDDKSHRALNIAKASKRFENTLDIRELRNRVLNGESFPINQNPQHEWFTGTPLPDL